jgi:putative flippase GtrA
VGEGRIKSRSLRFAVVGSTNAVLDFGVLNVLVLFGLPPVVANTISTGVSMTFGFFAHKKYTFKLNSRHRTREIVLFFAFTIFSAWVIQNLVMQGILWALPEIVPEFIAINGSKIIATGVSLIWNYLAYSRIVFRKQFGTIKTHEEN